MHLPKGRTRACLIVLTAAAIAPTVFALDSATERSRFGGAVVAGVVPARAPVTQERPAVAHVIPVFLDARRLQALSAARSDWAARAGTGTPPSSSATVAEFNGDGQATLLVETFHPRAPANIPVREASSLAAVVTATAPPRSMAAPANPAPRLSVASKLPPKSENTVDSESAANARRDAWESAARRVVGQMTRQWAQLRDRPPVRTSSIGVSSNAPVAVVPRGNKPPGAQALGLYTKQ